MTLVGWLIRIASFFGSGDPVGCLRTLVMGSRISCIMFENERFETYPGAKLIWTERDIDRWVISVEKTILEVSALPRPLEARKQHIKRRRRSHDLE